MYYYARKNEHIMRRFSLPRRKWQPAKARQEKKQGAAHAQNPVGICLRTATPCS